MIKSSLLEKVRERLTENGFNNITVREFNGGVLLEGQLSNYRDIVKCGKLAVIKKHSRGVINNIKFDGNDEIPMRVPNILDDKYDNRHVDALIVGGGIIGAAIARELSKYNISTLLIEKEYDLATAQSSRNDGMIHAGIDLKPFCKKVKYNMRGNRLYNSLHKELDVPISKMGQYVLLTAGWQKYLFLLVKLLGSLNKIPVRLYSAKKVKEKIKNVGFNHGAIFCPDAGVINPFVTTVAFAEVALQNGVEIALNTAALSIENNGEKVVSVKTNRGTIYPKVLINAAGVFSDKIAEMCGDRFFTIHPRRGVETILDKKAAKVTDSVIGKFVLKGSSGEDHTKGGGIVRTIEGNILVGPTASEVFERENTATSKEELDALFKKHSLLTADIKPTDVITYFAGTRAANYEEDFIVEKSPVIKNLVQAAGIQSPGITAAPAIAEDIAKFTIEILKEEKQVVKKDNFISKRKGIPHINSLPLKERDELIKKNPDYGIIVCRCEEISKGEIKDAIHSLLPAVTLDSVKRRVRSGMGRCQGGFCQPIITKIISEELNISLSDVNKKGINSSIVFAKNKEQ